MSVSMKNPQHYLKYLASKDWKIKRAVALISAGYECERCKTDNHLEVHHITYDRLGFERPDDLRVLCAACHADEHGRPNRTDRVLSLREASEKNPNKYHPLEDHQWEVLQQARIAAGFRPETMLP